MNKRKIIAKQGRVKTNIAYKLGLSAASILLGSTFLASSQVVKADTVIPNSQTGQSSVNNSSKKNSLNLSNEQNYSIGRSYNNSQDTTNKTNIIKQNDNKTSDNLATTAKTPQFYDNDKTIAKTKWNNIDISFNPETKELTIFGGTEQQPAIMKNTIDGESKLYPLEFSLSEMGCSSQDVKTIIIQGKIKLEGGAQGLFKGLPYLTKFQGLTNLDTTDVNDMAFMFESMNSVSTLDLSSFDTSNVRWMKNMFSGCRALTRIDLSSFDTSKVELMESMFMESSGIRELDLGNKFKFESSASGRGDGDNINNTLPGKWVNWGKTNHLARGEKIWDSSKDFFTKYQGATDYDTYVRFENLAAPITVQYREQDGQDKHKIEGIEDEKQFGNVNDKLIDQANPQFITSFKEKEIPGYKFDHAEINGQKVELDQVTYSSDPQTITLIYTKVKSDNSHGSGNTNNSYNPVTQTKGSDIKVNYEDENGNQLAPTETLSGYVGDGYVTETKEIQGYTLKVRPLNATGFFSSQPQTVTYIYSKNVATVTPIIRTVYHNSYLYDHNGSRKTGKYYSGTSITTYGKTYIQGREYYDLGNDTFVKVNNISGIKRKLKHNAYIYNKKAKRVGTKVLKKNKKVRVYGKAVKMHNKLYYIIGNNHFVKKANF